LPFPAGPDPEPDVIEALGQPLSIASAAFGEVDSPVKAPSPMPRRQCRLGGDRRFSLVARDGVVVAGWQVVAGWGVVVRAGGV
jgi:hypothetical protein